MKKQLDLTHGNILRGFLYFAFPLFLGSLFQQLYGTVDLLFVGNILGTTDAAAVGASSILVTCLIGLFTGISVGAGVVIAQLWGAKKQTEVIQCIETSLIIGIVGGVILTLIGLLLSRQALLWLNTPSEIMNHAMIYIRIYLLSILPMILYNLSAGILRAMGDSRTPFLVLAAGGFLNVCMDAFLIAFLNWGVAGAAVATMISQSFTAAVLTIYLILRYRIRFKRNFDWNLAVQILWIGCPLGIQSMILTLSNLFVQYFINGFGENAIAAFTVYFKAENLIYLPIMAFGQAMVTFTGQNYGAGNSGRIKRGAIQCNLFSAAAVAFISWILLLLGRPLLALFCNELAVIEEGLKIIHISFPFYFLYAFLEVTGGIIRGLGKTVQSMMIVIVNLCVIRVLLLGILVNSFHTIQAVAFVYPATWFVAALSFIIYYIWLLYVKRIT